MITVNINGEQRAYEKGTSYQAIADELQPQYPHDIVLVLVNNKLQELRKTLQEDCSMKMVTTADTAGRNAYRRSLTLMLLKAIYDVSGHDPIEKVRIHYTVSAGYYCTVDGDIILNQEFLDRVKERMNQMIAEKMPIKKRSVNTDEAVEIFSRHKMYDKEKLFKYRRVSKVNLYSMNEFEDYYYGYMVPHAGYLKYFELHLYDEGFVIQFPKTSDPTVVPPFEPRNKLFQVMKESVKWGDMLGLDTVGALNDTITQGNISEFVLVQEALQEKRIAEIAQMISEKKDKKFVMIAGPSSSGKTTFSHRLSIQLQVNGLKPHPIALDNYFVDREHTPQDEHGKPDYECLEALDIETFNKNMTDLLDGQTVELPTYNFKTGKREYLGNTKSLGPDDILVIEGIHGLNGRLSYSLPEESKFKIYISALTQLNIDEHNRIPTTDGRLIRRLVRDARTRGISAKQTINMWYSVRRGEESYIFPHQEQADVMFNSAMIYELSVLKQYAEPILFGIDKSEPEYLEAKRLLKFLDYFVAVPGEDIPQNSILREFIGGSCFHV